MQDKDLSFHSAFPKMAKKTSGYSLKTGVVQNVYETQQFFFWPKQCLADLTKFFCTDGDG